MRVPGRLVVWKPVYMIMDTEETFMAWFDERPASPYEGAREALYSLSLIDDVPLRPRPRFA